MSIETGNVETAPRRARAAVSAATAPRARRAALWRRANGEVLQHALAALRHRLAVHCLILREARAGEPLAAHRHRLVADEELERLLAAGGKGAPDSRRDDPRVADRVRRRREAERAAADKAEALCGAGTPPAWSVLAARFALGDFERWALLAAAAPELEPSFARLYAYANDDAGRPWPTPHLLSALLADLAADGALRDAFLPGAPLLHWGLLRRGGDGVRPDDGPAALAALHVDARVVAFLDGVHRPDPALSHLLTPVAVPPAAEVHRATAERLAAWLAAPSEGGGRTVQLCGRPGAGRRAVAALVARRLGLPLHAVDLARLAAGDEAWATLRRLAREARLLPTALVLDAGDAGAGADGRGELDRLLVAVETLPGPLFVTSREPLRLDRHGRRGGGPVIDVPRLDGPSRAALLRAALKLGESPAVSDEDDGLATAVAAVSEQFDLGPEAVAQAVTAAGQEARLAAGGEGGRIDGPALWRACRRLAGAEMDDLAQRIEPVAGWDDIVLPADVAARLREVAAQVAHRATVYGDWGFGPRLNRGRGIAALFAGPSGTGKTMAAEVLARHLDLDLYRIDLAGVVSKYIGETERNLRRVFDAAETGGALLFFDEADALFGRRTEVKDSHDRYANVEIDYLLQRMEEYRGLAILASNRKTALDRAFLRRLRFVVEFPFPDAAARRRIWRLAFPPETPVARLDWDALSRLELAGGNIRNVSLNAAFLAADAGEAVGMVHLAAAVRAEYAKCEKAMSQGEMAVLSAAEEAAA